MNIEQAKRAIAYANEQINNLNAQGALEVGDFEAFEGMACKAAATLREAGYSDDQIAVFASYSFDAACA